MVEPPTVSPGPSADTMARMMPSIEMPGSVQNDWFSPATMASFTFWGISS